MSDEKTTQEKGFEEQPTHEYVPGLDELALRLQVEPQNEPFTGVVLFGKTGKAYSITQLMAHHMQFVAEGIELAANIYDEIKKEGDKFESNKRSRQSKKTNNTSRDSKGDKS